MHTRTSRPYSRLTVTLAAVSLLMTSACGLGGDDSPPPLKRMPRSVPEKPLYRDASAVVDKLTDAGLPCKVVRKAPEVEGRLPALTCRATVDGETFESEIAVSPPRDFNRDEIGDTIAARRESTPHRAVVAAGNWFVDVADPQFAPRFAQALGGVVLKPAASTEVPEYRLPRIPHKPRYASSQDVADRLGRIAGCRDRETTPTGGIACNTGNARDSNCAVVSVYSSEAKRDEELRRTIRYKNVPVRIVTAGNWSVNLCDFGLADEVAKSMGGVVVSYGG